MCCPDYHFLVFFETLCFSKSTKMSVLSTSESLPLLRNRIFFQKFKDYCFPFDGFNTVSTLFQLLNTVQLSFWTKFMSSILIFAPSLHNHSKPMWRTFLATKDVWTTKVLPKPLTLEVEVWSSTKLSQIPLVSERQGSFSLTGLILLILSSNVSF